MIRSFGCRDTERLFQRPRGKRFPPDIHRVGLRKLRMLHHASNLQDLRVLPANRLEALRGKRKGRYSIRINNRYRVCFRWQAGDAFDVEIVDSH